MSYIRRTERRRYFDGVSESYVYPTHNHVIVKGDIHHYDFWEIVLRALEETDIDPGTFDEVSEAVVEHAHREMGQATDPGEPDEFGEELTGGDE